MSDATENNTEAQKNTSSSANTEPKHEMGNILSHIQKLEASNTELKSKLDEAIERNGKLSQKTREGMQSALDTLMKKWMDAVETKDGKVKDGFKDGLEKLVKNSAEDNGVWQMMVAASALHERQEHNLDKLRTENTELRQKMDGYYATPESRTVGEKSKAEDQLSRNDVAGDNMSSIWDDFAASIGNSAY